MLNGIITPLSARPLLTFCTFSVLLQKKKKKKAFYSGWQFAELKNKEGVGVSTKSGSDPRFLGALHYYQRIKHHIFDLEWFGGTLEWGHPDYRGRMVSEWRGYEWEHSLGRKFQTGVDSCFWITPQKRIRRYQNVNDVTGFYLARLVINRILEIGSQHSRCVA